MYFFVLNEIQHQITFVKIFPQLYPNQHNKTFSYLLNLVKGITYQSRIVLICSFQTSNNCSRWIFFHLSSFFQKKINKKGSIVAMSLKNEKGIGIWKKREWNQNEVSKYTHVCMLWNKIWGFAEGFVCFFCGTILLLCVWETFFNVIERRAICVPYLHAMPFVIFQFSVSKSSTETEQFIYIYKIKKLLFAQIEISSICSFRSLLFIVKQHLHAISYSRGRINKLFK